MNIITRSNQYSVNTSIPEVSMATYTHLKLLTPMGYISDSMVKITDSMVKITDSMGLNY